MLRLKPGEGIRIERPGTGEVLAVMKVAESLKLEIEMRLTDEKGVLLRIGRSDEGHEAREDFRIHFMKDRP